MPDTGQTEIFPVQSVIIFKPLIRKLRNAKDNIMGNMSLFKKFCFLLLLVFLYGCASKMNLAAHRNEWITRPLSELKQEMSNPDSYASKIKWEETTYQLANGNFVFVEPVGRDCSVHWEVIPKGIIVGFQARGNGCEQEQSPDNFIQTLTAPSKNW